MIENIIIIKTASVSIGIALNRAFINTLRPLMAEILFKGLMTLKLLNPDRLNLPPDASSL
jgi:pheromone shutdown protein TraB